MTPTFLTAPSPLLPPPPLVFTLPSTKRLPFHPSFQRSFFRTKPSSSNSYFFTFKFHSSRFVLTIRSSKSSAAVSDVKTVAIHSQNGEVLSEPQSELNVEVRSPVVPSIESRPKLSLSDEAFFLLAFIVCMTSAAFVGLVAAAVPTLSAMGRAAISLSKLADTAREELPSTMASIRLSGMEISDLTLKLSDLSSS